MDFGNIPVGAVAALLQMIMDDPECRTKLETFWEYGQRELKQNVIGDLVNHISEVEHAIMTRNVADWAKKEILKVEPQSGGVFSSYEDARYDVLKEVLNVCGRKPAEPEPDDIVIDDDNDDDDIF